MIRAKQPESNWRQADQMVWWPRVQAEGSARRAQESAPDSRRGAAAAAAAAAAFAPVRPERAERLTRGCELVQGVRVAGELLALSALREPRLKVLSAEAERWATMGLGMVAILPGV